MTCDVFHEKIWLRTFGENLTTVTRLARWKPWGLFVPSRKSGRSIDWILRTRRFPPFMFNHTNRYRICVSQGSSQSSSSLPHWRTGRLTWATQSSSISAICIDSDAFVSRWPANLICNDDARKIQLTGARRDLATIPEGKFLVRKVYRLLAQGSRNPIRPDRLLDTPFKLSSRRAKSPKWNPLRRGPRRASQPVCPGGFRGPAGGSRSKRAVWCAAASMAASCSLNVDHCFTRRPPSQRTGRTPRLPWISRERVVCDGGESSCHVEFQVGRRPRLKQRIARFLHHDFWPSLALRTCASSVFYQPGIMRYP